MSLELVGDVASLCARAFLATTRLFNNNFLVGVDVVYISAGELVFSREKEEEDALHHQCEQYSMSMWFTYSNAWCIASGVGRISLGYPIEKSNDCVLKTRSSVCCLAFAFF